MDKRDWKEAKRREKAAAAGTKTQTLGESTGAPSQSPLSPSGANTQTSTEDPEANAYHPEMDEMRCLLWAHGGLDPLPVMFRFSWVLTDVCASRRWLLFRERGSGKV